MTITDTLFEFWRMGRDLDEYGRVEVFHLPNQIRELMTDICLLVGEVELP